MVRTWSTDEVRGRRVSYRNMLFRSFFFFKKSIL